MGRWFELANALPLTSREDRVVISIAVVPTRVMPFSSQTGLIDVVHSLCCLITDPSGTSGFGHAMFLSRTAAEQSAQLAVALSKGRAGSLRRLLSLEFADYADQLRADQVSHSAASAISLAAWDLAARQRNVSCAELWGGELRPLQCYDSNFLAFAALESIDAAIAQLRANHFTLAKLAVGANEIDLDIARIKAAQAGLGPGHLAIDPVRRWTVAQVQHVLSRLDAPLMWFEDAVPYGDLGQLRAVPNLAAGETCCTAAALHELVDAGVRNILPDVGCMGGPLRLIEGAVALAERGAAVGSHAYPYYSLHMLSCLRDPLPVEVMHWGNELFVDPPAPGRDGRMTACGPGFGLTVNETHLANAAEWFLAGI